jgi:hypothetical protein
MTNNKPLQISNSIKTILFDGFEEIVGGDNLIFNNPNHLAKESDYIDSLESYSNPDNFNYAKKMFLEQYGELGSRGIAIRTGEASFRTFIRLNGNGYNLTNMEYRLMNSYQRCLFGLKKIALFLKENCGMAINIIDFKDSWNIEVEINEFFQEWNDLLGDFLLGLFREFFIWTSGGRFYILEPQMIRINENQIFSLKINKQPLGN